MTVSYVHIAFQPKEHSDIRVTLDDDPEEEAPVSVRFDGLRLWLSKEQGRTLRNLLYGIDINDKP